MRPSQKVTSERREKVWHLMLEGNNVPSIIKIIGSYTPKTIYQDVNYLKDESRRYLYDIAKGTHILLYKKSIDILDKVMIEAWNKFHDNKTPEKEKIGYLRIVKDIAPEYFNLICEGPSMMQLDSTYTDMFPRKSKEEVDFNDFLKYYSDPKLVTSGCVYMNRKNKSSITGNPGYTHRQHKEGEYCYLKEYEEKNNCFLTIRTDQPAIIANDSPPELQSGSKSEPGDASDEEKH